MAAIDRWNAALGYRVGQPLRKPKRRRPQTPAGRTADIKMRYNLARMGSPSVSAPTRRAAGGGSGVSTLSSQGQQSAMANVYDTLVNDYKESVNKQAAIDRSVEGGSNPSGGESIFNRTLDILSRVPNAAFGGLENLAAQEERTGFSPGDLAYTTGNLLSGVWGGLSGKEQTGGGEIYESYKNNPTTALGGPLRALEESHPAIEQALAITAGVGAEAFLDPYNYLLPGGHTVMRQTGKLATRELLQQTTQTAVRNAVDDVVQNTPLLARNRYLLGNPEALAGRVGADADEAFNAGFLEVMGGGAPRARVINDPANLSTVTQRWEQSMTDTLAGGSEVHVMNVWDNAKSGLTRQYVDNARRYNPDFRTFWDDLTNDLVARGVSPGSSVDEILAVLKGGKVGKADFFKHWNKIKQGYHIELAPYTQKLFNNLENPVRKTLGFRVGGKVIKVPALGRAYGWAGTKLGARASAAGLGKAFYERALPNLFANKISRARAYGIKGLDNMVRELRRVARGLDPATGNRLHGAFSPDEARELYTALENGLTTLGDTRKDWALTWLRQKLNDVFDNEAVEGARSIDGLHGSTKSVRQNDYVHVHAKGGSKADRELFFKERQKAYDTHNANGGWNTDKARSMGLRPVDDAFQMLMLRYMKSGNDITKASLWQDIINNYAIMGGKPVLGLDENLKHGLASTLPERRLKQVSYSKLSQAYKDMVNSTTGKFYIPDSMHQLLDQAEKMLDWNTSDWNRFGRSFASIMSKFKIALTIPYPGFHFRNFIGDTMMGMLDGVRPTMYAEVIRKYSLNKAGRAPRIKIIDGIEYSFDEFIELFSREANTGFINTEIATYGTMTAGRMPRQLGRRVGETARDLSDKRELLPRVTHYLQAYRDEARALARKNIPLDKIEQRARDAALWRVNHFKFDYNALMPWEKTLKATAFPFYTYMRKAMPTLLEQMFINPHYFTMVHRFMQENDGSAADAFNAMNIPDWIRDLGFVTLTDEANPLVMTGDILPSNALDILNSRDIKEAAGDLIANLAPPLQAPFELAYGRTMFDQQPINNTYEYLADKLPLVGDIQREFVDIPFLPGGTNEDTFWENLTGETSRLNLLSSRLGGINAIRRVSEGMQEQQMESNFDRLIENPIQNFNYSNGRFSINMNDQGAFSIFDKFSGESLPTQFLTSQQALDFANTLPKFPTNNTSTLRPPNKNDVLNLLTQQQ